MEYEAILGAEHPMWGEIRAVYNRIMVPLKRV
jgi:hypothetical protein